jgi:N-acetylglucosaminyl-diphospho-decaprenol L-rhamnosyltransferase
MERTKIDLSIIIVNWKSKDFLHKCIESICQHTKALSFEMVVIDNASFDGCGEMLAQHFPSVRFIQSNENLGFSRANNLAFNASRGDAVLFLNPDTELVGPAINELFNVLSHNLNVGAVGAKLLNSDGTLQLSCIQSFPTVANQILDADILRRLFPRLWLWGMAPLFISSETPSEVEAIVGACVMLKRSVFETVGGFDPGYFMYAEDIDLSFKVRQAGFKSYFVPRATLKHFGGGSSQSARSYFASVMMKESVYRFFKIRRGPGSAWSYRVLLAVSAMVRLPFALLVDLGRQHSSLAGKWLAILKWTLGRESWTQQRSTPKPSPLAA